MIDKRGSYYSYGETRLGQGRENARTYLKEHPEIAWELETALRSLAGFHMGDPGSEESEEQELVMEEFFDPGSG